MMKLEPAQIKKELTDLLQYLILFLKNPVQGMRAVPSFSWPVLLVMQAASAMVSGALVGVLEASFLDFLFGTLVFPVSSVVLSFLFALLIYYYFSLIHATFLEFRRLYGIIVFANIPYFLLHAVAGYIPPIDLIGYAFSSLLLVIGLVEHFQLERKRVVRLIGMLYLLFFLVWAASQLSGARESESTPATDTFDEIERSIQQ